MKVSAVLACSLSGSFLEVKCSENGPRREPKSLKIAFEKLVQKTIVFLIDFGSEKVPKSIPLGFFRGPFSVLGALGPQNIPNMPQCFFFHTFSRIFRVFALIFDCFCSFPGDPCGNLRRLLQHFVMPVLCVSLIVFNVFVLFPRVPCGNLRKFCLGFCWCFARFFLQRCLTCRTSPAALFGSGLPPQVPKSA